MAAGKLIWVKRIYQQAVFRSMIVVFLVNVKKYGKAELGGRSGRRYGTDAVIPQLSGDYYERSGD